MEIEKICMEKIMTKSFNQVDKKSINTIRGLSIDAIELANSGHPGLPLGAAPMAYVLYKNHLKVNPKNTTWFDRDRFVLSAGHGSALLYSLLYLGGFKLNLEDLKNFRQLGSKTPGHPEFGHTDGVETTTGPLGQGAANAVGMALAEKMLGAKFNKEDLKLIDHYTYCLVGDGCLMEGISAEAASFAGHQKLGKLIYLYDSNDISLDGPTDLSFTEDVAKRYESYGWQVLLVENGDEDLEAINAALIDAKKELEKPSLIIVKTTIGFGSPNKSGSAASHGAPLGAEEIKLTKKALGIENDEPFFTSDEVKSNFKDLEAKRKEENDAWNKLLEEYKAKYPSNYEEFLNFKDAKLSPNWDEELLNLDQTKAVATRVSSHEALNAVANKVNWLMGGDADLSCSTKTFIKADGNFLNDDYQRNIKFGVREHAMGAIANGISCHGGLKPFVGTFFSFVDYMRPTLRLSALSNLPVVYIYTHDSIAVGEDGPTHQPIEQLASVRAIPNLKVLRPAEINEVKYSWKYIMENPCPICLVLTRQNVAAIDQNKYGKAENLAKGAYILAEDEGFDTIIMASGSEVGLSLKAKEQLNKDGFKVRVISMPSFEIFEEQDKEYQEYLLPAKIRKRISIEAGISMGWYKYTGLDGLNISVEEFGTSAPGDEVLREYGFSVEAVVEKIKKYCKA